MKPPIIVTLEGGLVSSVSSSDPGTVGQEVLVIDYDGEPGDGLDSITCAPPPGTEGKPETAKAYVRWDMVTRTWVTDDTVARLRNRYLV